ncbi:hypothetical protein ACR78F_04335 [Sphingobacterium spiritivorum]|uniref:Uncharacterized protein n=3 Tax=Sphingobacterium spiritivorum TaxID=258 RepID=D7VLY5_SPHSI|nr:MULTISPECIES: hypothetical protein [Sphingobacterium]EEI90079.1 hypothetical protein HMPREF0765_4292 [Sphingobacterium spiritivorum ATCC 33300]EFK57990.1 hypothetical protein HMPREF0766_11982 [Sphingobacterium spiritivorum ATCC 33861]QQS95038.1 hypothetical protein I6J03_16890 [Sphingobacterium spiritivorum]QQT26335.1 hypothetical protein I6J02_00325 [Sphingobacterium spiritivorum]QQT34745.1 hypothetical protein I6J01_15755 [Sphingobacterium spiritivorum]
MDKLKKFELMEKIVRELEDVRNSQQAVLEKIGKIEVDNIELGDKNLENTLPDIYQRTADNSDAIRDLLNSFQEKTDDFGEKNNVDKLKEQQQINSIK